MRGSNKNNNEGFDGFDAIQLTDETLAKLTELELSDVFLFHFYDGSKDKNTPQCKTMPGDDLYPDETAWNTLDISSGATT